MDQKLFRIHQTMGKHTWVPMLGVSPGQIDKEYGGPPDLLGCSCGYMVGRYRGSRGNSYYTQGATPHFFATALLYNDNLLAPLFEVLEFDRAKWISQGYPPGRRTATNRYLVHAVADITKIHIANVYAHMCQHIPALKIPTEFVRNMENRILCQPTSTVSTRMPQPWDMLDMYEGWDLNDDDSGQTRT